MHKITADEVFERTPRAHLWILRPNFEGRERAEMAPLLAIADDVADDVVRSLIVGGDWRSTLVGLVLAMSEGFSRFAPEALESLRTPKGIAITAAWAFLTLCCLEEEIHFDSLAAHTFDRATFDGEMGWAIDKAKYHSGNRPDDVSGIGPHYAQVFEDYLKLFRWWRSMSRRR